MVVFAKVKYLITFAGTFYFFWLQVMGIIWSMSGKTGPSQGLRIYNSCDYMATSTITLFISFIHHQRISEDLKKKKLNFMRVFIGQAALTFCSPSLSYSRGARGGGELLGILGGGVPPGSSNPDPISNQKYHFHTSFQTWPLKSIPILRPAFNKLCHHY